MIQHNRSLSCLISLQAATNRELADEAQVPWPYCSIYIILIYYECPSV